MHVNVYECFAQILTLLTMKGSLFATIRIMLRSIHYLSCELICINSGDSLGYAKSEGAGPSGLWWLGLLKSLLGSLCRYLHNCTPMTHRKIPFLNIIPHQLASITLHTQSAPLLFIIHLIHGNHFRMNSS